MVIFQIILQNLLKKKNKISEKSKNNNDIQCQLNRSNALEVSQDNLNDDTNMAIIITNKGNNYPFPCHPNDLISSVLKKYFEEFP